LCVVVYEAQLKLVVIEVLDLRCSIQNKPIQLRFCFDKGNLELFLKFSIEKGVSVGKEFKQNGKRKPVCLRTWSIHLQSDVVFSNHVKLVLFDFQDRKGRGDQSIDCLIFNCKFEQWSRLQLSTHFWHCNLKERSKIVLLLGLVGFNSQSLRDSGFL
jgi:hypothetical protein